MTIDDLMARVVASREDEEAWKAARRGKITASKAASFAKLSSAGTYAAADLKEWAGDTVYTDRGNFWEKHALEALGFTPNPYLFHALENPDHLATPDAVRQTETGLEIAETKATKHAKVTIDGEPVPPATHYRQMQWQMYVCGPDVRVCHYLVVPLGPNGELLKVLPYRARIARDDQKIAALLEIAAPVLQALRAVEQIRLETES